MRRAWAYLRADRLTFIFDRTGHCFEVRATVIPERLHLACAVLYWPLRLFGIFATVKDKIPCPLNAQDAKAKT